MPEIHIDNMAYGVCRPVYDEYVRQKEEIRLLKLSVDREVSKNTILSELYGSAKIKLGIATQIYSAQREQQ